MPSILNYIDVEDNVKFKSSLEFVEGIGLTYAEKLKVAGCFTCLDLLEKGATTKGRAEIAENSGIPSNLIFKWVNQVDLFRIKGVGPEYAELLVAAGVYTVDELAQRNPVRLINAILRVNAERNLVRRLPTLSQVESWVAQAKILPRVVVF